MRLANPRDSLGKSAIHILRHRVWQWTLLLSLCPVPPASAQTAPTDPATAHAQSGQHDIIVTGRTEEQKSDWKRAESDHVIVFSTGNEDELKRITTNLELLHTLMTRLYRRGDTSDDALKMQVTLVDSQSRLRAMGLRDVRSQEGPFPASFASIRYYDPREDGEVLAVARTDQMIDLETNRRFHLDCEAYQENGGADLCPSTRHMPVARPWEAHLYAAFAQHFMLTYVPAAYPRWYLDGIGALFSTIKVKRDGAMDYADAPEGFKDIFLSYGYPNISEILSGRYLDDPKSTAAWSPYGAWLLTHYFIFSNPKPERARQFQHYMAAIRQGTPMAEAAAVFGNMQSLQREVQAYAGSDIFFAHAKAPQTPVADPLITTLSLAGGTLVEARLGLESRLAALPAGAADPGSNEDWLGQVRGKIAGLPYDTDALLFEAEAECRSGRDGECLATAERVLARSPDNVGALAWKGVALTGQAIAGPSTSRSERLADARRTLGRAIALDAQAPLPLIAYYQSFTRAGEQAPEDAMHGMATVIRSVPAAPAPRLYLAQELVRDGKADLARRVLGPVLYGPYDSPEKRNAEMLFPADRHEVPIAH